MKEELPGLTCKNKTKQKATQRTIVALHKSYLAKNNVIIIKLCNSTMKKKSEKYCINQSTTSYI